MKCKIKRFLLFSVPRGSIDDRERGAEEEEKEAQKSTMSPEEGREARRSKHDNNAPRSSCDQEFKM
jgi:hypothetical protein